MKEIIDNGLDVLVNANVSNFWVFYMFYIYWWWFIYIFFSQIGDGKQVYKDVDLDGIREDWAHYVSNFVLAWCLINCMKLLFCILIT